jgi:hypothetical protein
MGDKQKNKIENYLKDVEERFTAVSRLSLTDKKTELKRISTILGDLDSNIQRFQMTEYIKYPDECELFEQKHSELTEKFKQLLNSEHGEQLSDLEDEEDPDAAQLEIRATTSKLQEGKARAIAMLQTVNNMRQEINEIDDEVLMQREKLLNINSKLKDTAGVLNQTKKVISSFSKALYDDIIMMVLIGIIAIIVLTIIGMAISIKIKQGDKVKIRAEREATLSNSTDFDDIDEEYFFNLENHKSAVQKPIKPKETPTDQPKSGTEAGGSGPKNPSKVL